MLLYAVTVFLSAYLLFQIQPVIAKQILPWFGGSAALWTTCLVFFQVVLLAGYLYAHWLVLKLPSRAQALLHTALVAVSLFFLPVIPPTGWKPEGPELPALRVLALLAATVGLPYLLLSTTSPLVQAWFARRYRHAMPYRLFSISNLASLAALVSYPFLFEPNSSVLAQARVWSAGYALFAVLSCAAAWLSSRSGEGVPAAPADDGPPDPGWSEHLLWMLLAAFPSALLIAITNHLTQTVASAPFLWVLPLALYLLSFVLCFGLDGWYRRFVFLRLLAVALIGMGYFLWNIKLLVNPRGTLFVFLGGLFAVCVFGHGELALRKPDPRHLTAFYCMVALGGALGGVLVSVAAPLLLTGYFELPAGLFALAVFVLVLTARRSWNAAALWGVVAVFLLLIAVGHIRAYRAKVLYMARNFYGTLRVADFPSARSGEMVRTLIHGPIDHGRQFLSPALRGRPTSYFGVTSGVGLVLASAPPIPWRVGVVGLGTGTLAIYGRPGDLFRFYELNPLVIGLARSKFSFLADTQAKVEIVPGDGRLSLEREAPQKYDLLAVDAFSGDAIPLHLLTVEAFRLYLRHLGPGGVLALHISNRSLDLAPVVGKAAAELSLQGLVVRDPGHPADETTHSVWALVSAGDLGARFPALKLAGSPLPSRPGLPLWTDDYSNLFRILR